MAKILWGEPVAKSILESIEEQTRNKPHELAVIQVGAHPVSEKYIKAKQAAAESLGIVFRRYQYSQTIGQEELSREVQKICRFSRTTGAIIQLPLPTSLATQEVLDAIPVEKDVDVLSSAAFGKFSLGTLPILPPTVGAIASLLSHYKIAMRGKRVVVVGSGRLVGLPLSLWLMQQRATVVMTNRSTLDLKKLVLGADIVVSGTGAKNLITGDMIKKGAVVIDAGTSVESGKTAGDVEMESVARKAGAVAPVPGGVGPLTVACLLQNLVLLAGFRNGR